MKIHLLLTIVITNSLFAQVSLVHEELNKFQNLRDFSLTQALDEVFFTIQSPNQEISQIVCVKNGKWSSPELLSFCDAYSYMEPFISYDGKRLYFASDRPKNDSIKSKGDFDIWFVERKNRHTAWSKPINAGSKVNSVNNEFYPTLSINNNLYFTMDAASGLGKDDIYYCHWDGKEYAKPVLLSTSINSEGYEFNAFVSKEETFLLYTKYNAKDGLGSGDLYISYRKEGEWTPATNMGSLINTKYMEYCPFYDSQSNTLYFTSKRDQLTPQKFMNFEDLHKYISVGENGLSKIYKYKIKL